MVMIEIFKKILKIVEQYHPLLDRYYLTNFISFEFRLSASNAVIKSSYKWTKPNQIPLKIL